MKILHRGEDPKDKIYRPTCRNCRTQVEFTRDDPEVRYNNDQRDGDYLSCACPVCTSTITVAVGLGVSPANPQPERLPSP